jgi:hypothetical protein
MHYPDAVRVPLVPFVRARQDVVLEVIGGSRIGILSQLLCGAIERMPAKINRRKKAPRLFILDPPRQHQGCPCLSVPGGPW